MKRGAKQKKRQEHSFQVVYEFILVESENGMDLYFDLLRVPISIGHHFPNVPQFDCLVFSIGYETPAISTTINMRYSMQMSSQNPSSLSCGQTTSVPYLQTTEIRCRSTDEMSRI